jgi:single-stranded-DNA-specific exonuclease
LFKLNIAGKVLTTTDISWQLSPAINSTGRMGQAEMAVRLLTEEDARRREQLAGEIIAMNEERKKIGADSWTLVEPRAKESLETYHGKLVLAWGNDIHRGVTGIMANRLVSVFKVPAIVVSFINEHEATGSLRSTRGYDLRGILEQCADLFIDHGGHSYAAGFSMRRENWNAFIQRLGQAAHTVELGDSQNEEILSVDAELPAAMMNAELLSVLDRFEPFGEGNPPLLFLGRKLKVNDIQLMGRNEVRHVKLSLDAGAFKWPAIYWQAGDKVKSEFDMGDMVDIVFRAGRNWFNGNETPQLTIQDLKRT